MLLFIKTILSLIKDPFKSLTDRVKEDSFYKVFVSGFPEILISIYVISVIVSIAIGSEKGGIRGVSSFLNWVHFEALGAPIENFVKWIGEQGEVFENLFSIALIFVFLSSLSYYLRDSQSRICSLNEYKISSVSNSSYMLIFSTFAIIDYVNIAKHRLDFILFWVAIIILVWIGAFYFNNHSEFAEAKSKWDEIKEDWHENKSFYLFAAFGLFYPLFISIFSPLILLGFILVGVLDSPSGGAVLFNGTRESREKKRKEIEESLNKLKEKLHERYRGNSNYRAKVRAAIQVAGRNSKIIPVFSGENVADIVRHTLKYELARPLIIVTEVDGEIYTYIIQ